jgi:ribosomal protein S18 acetylase RimI-like enzyme
VLQPDILDLLRLPLRPRSRARWKEIAETYRTSEHHFVFVATSRGRAIGCVGIERHTDLLATIHRLAVAAGERNRGVGKQLVLAAMETVPCVLFAAETDRDAVGSYERCGFTILSLGEKYPGVERFACTYAKRASAAACHLSGRHGLQGTCSQAGGHGLETVPQRVPQRR